MSRPPELEREARLAVPAALAAFAAAALPILASIAPGVLVEGRLDTLSSQLAGAAREPAVFLLAGAALGIGTAALAGVFLYLYRAAKLRRPETPQVAGVLAVAGPVLLAVVFAVTPFAFTSVGAEFAESGPHTESRAQQLLRDSSLSTLRSVRVGAGAAFGLAWVLVSVAIMRSGLVSRFAGVLGIAVGVLNAVPILGPPVVLQTFWLVALGVLLLDRWPGGRGPAWRTGEATPWPVRARGGGGAAARSRGADGDTEREALPDVQGADGKPPAPPRRKRKRRR